jgi:hypothetical protein
MTADTHLRIGLFVLVIVLIAGGMMMVGVTDERGPTAAPVDATETHLFR